MAESRVSGGRSTLSPLARALLRIDGVARTLGALVGTAVVALLLAQALAAFLPIPVAVRFPLAALLVPLLWVAGMCAAFLARRGWQVWLAVIAAAVALWLALPHAALM
jgi:hypothetical protein